MAEIVNNVIDIVFSRIGDSFANIANNIATSILSISYTVALLGAGLAILFGIIGLEKYYKVAGAFFLGYVLINYLMR